MAGFHEISFPENISYNSSGGPGYRTQIIELDSGEEQRIARRALARHQYNVAWAIKSHSDLAIVKQFFIGRQGALNGFRFKDFGDFSTDASWRGTPSPTDVHFGTGDGSQTVWQLFKPYTSGAIIRNRTITKPVGSTVRVAADYVEVLSGWSVNSTTGQITFTSPPANGVLLFWGGEFEVPVRFGADSDTLLNSTIEDFDSGSIDNIMLVELLTSTPVGEEFFYGGSVRYSIGSSVTISQLQGRVHAITPTTSGLSVTLPDGADLAGGGPHFFLINESGSNSLAIKYFDGTSVGTLAASTGKTLTYESNSGLWYMI